jgi:CheY-like chemotaxis protein
MTGPGRVPPNFSASALPPRLARARVLVAGDSAANRQATIGLLLRLGCTARGVNNGREALAELERASYDIVLMDCQMPVMDGYEATRAIREWERNPSRPRGWTGPLYIVAMTANAAQGDEKKRLAAGMNHDLTQPVLLADLQSALEHWRPTVRAMRRVA